MAKASDNDFPSILLTEQASAPTTPAAGKRRIYWKTDNKFYVRDESGTETEIGAGGGGAPTTAKYITSAADGGLSAEIVIPGLAGSPDIPPGGGSDDEFDTTDTSDPMTGWTTMGSPTAHDINSTIKSHYYIKVNANAGTSFCGIYKAMSPAFTVTTRVSDYTSALNYNMVSLFVAEASPGKMWSISAQHSTIPFDIRTESWTGPTSGSANVLDVAERFGRPPIYFRIIVTSSTNVTFLYSCNGLIYVPVASAINVGFTVGAAGIAVQPISASNAMEAAFDWIRFT